MYGYVYLHQLLLVMVMFYFSVAHVFHQYPVYLRSEVSDDGLETATCRLSWQSMAIADMKGALAMTMPRCSLPWTEAYSA